jgi:predicted dehydrogenase
MGHRRAEALRDNDELVACFDPKQSSAERLAREFGGQAVGSAAAVLEHRPDAVIVATPHDRLADLAIESLRAGAHVLVEKPAGLSGADVDRIAVAADAAARIVKVGFNHRFAPAIQRAVELAHSGEFGDLMFARARYGHGGRAGYEQEWRLRREISGGGELVDQGMHLLDIFHWLFGPLPLHSALLRRHFWAGAVEDNALFTLADPFGESGPWATAHVSWTEWKNLFSLEIYCRTAKFSVDGLAGSYGSPRLTIYKMKPEFGPPETETVEFDGPDLSWRGEWQHFVAAIRGDVTHLLGGLADARYAWSCVEAAYDLSRGPAFARAES